MATVGNVLQSLDALTLINAKAAFTHVGGLAIRLLNKTGAPSVKGMLVAEDATTDDAFHLTPLDAPDIIGAVYEAGVADGALCWVVVNGIAEVYFAGNTVHGQFARMIKTGEPVAAAGVAIAEALPTSPFATDKHFMEVGHIIQSITGPGLARIVMHFN
jgi:hypothetical protein